MSVAELIGVLERRHGVRLDELTERRLHQALAETTAGTGETLAARARRVAADPALQRDVLARITLQESSFFREPAVFGDLAALVLPAAIRAAAGGPLVVWSVGCADGQEAWSVAMLLAELGAPRFEVVASDLSAVAAERCATAVYAERELRGLSGARRARFMVSTGATWRVRDTLRRRVRVVHHNVATEPAPVRDGSCALVLCRYVLIYLTPEATERVVARAARALTPEGRLIVGATESLWHEADRFLPEALPHAVVYRPTPEGGRAHPPSRPDGPAAQRIPPHGAVAPNPAERRTAPTTLHATSGATPTKTGGDAGAALLRQGESAAARGDLAVAAERFREAAAATPDDVVVLARLGLVLEAQGDPGAAGAFGAAATALAGGPPGALEARLGVPAARALARLLAEKAEVPR